MTFFLCRDTDVSQDLVALEECKRRGNVVIFANAVELLACESIFMRILSSTSLLPSLISIVAEFSHTINCH